MDADERNTGHKQFCWVLIAGGNGERDSRPGLMRLRASVSMVILTGAASCTWWRSPTEFVCKAWVFYGVGHLVCKRLEQSSSSYMQLCFETPGMPRPAGRHGDEPLPLV